MGAVAPADHLDAPWASEAEARQAAEPPRLKAEARVATPQPPSAKVRRRDA